MATTPNRDIGEVKAAARNRWPGILEALGIDRSYLTGRNGPCPMCGGEDRWRFTDKNSDGLWWCNKCGTGDGFRLLTEYHGWALPDAIQKVGDVVGQVTYIAPQKEGEQKIRRSLNTLREEAVPAHQVPDVVRYLENRGLIVPPGLQAHPSLQYYDGPNLVGRYAAILGKLIDPDGKPVGYHRIWVDRSGRKAPVDSPRKLRKLPSADTYAIRLWPANQTVCIAEGIETAIACYMLWQIPAWSVVTAGVMRKFEPPKGIKNILFAADNDHSFTGQAAAYETAYQLKKRGYHTEVWLPPQRGQDWNDFIEVQGMRETG